MIATGPLVIEIRGWLGYDLPLAWERGYHIHLEPGEGRSLTRAVHDVDGGFAIVPMQQGVRITTGVEIAARGAPPVRPGHPFGGTGPRRPRDEGRDRRDAMDRTSPDDGEFTSVIGPAPRHDRLWFNFGHQHIGLSMGRAPALPLPR